MKKLNRYSIFIVLGLCLLLGWCAMPSAHYRYRLTIEINTPTGVRSASAVHEVTWSHGGGVISGFIGKLRGEAVFVDIGPGLNGNPIHVIALVPDERFVPRVLGYPFRDAQYRQYAQVQGVHEVSSQDPSLTLVNFLNVNDPASAKIIHGRRYESRCREDRKPACVPEGIPIPIDELANAFGPGHAFRRATIEIVSPGIWPFSTISARWPESLFGASITREIENRLPLLVSYKHKLWTQRTSPIDRYTPQWHQFIRGF